MNPTWYVHIQKHKQKRGAREAKRKFIHKNSVNSGDNIQQFTKAR